jgi:hypothetical protein
MSRIGSRFINDSEMNRIELVSLSFLKLSYRFSFSLTVRVTFVQSNKIKPFGGPRRGGRCVGGGVGVRPHPC